MTDELRAHLRELGRKGGTATKSKYTTEDFRRWGRKGGRPKAKKARKIRAKSPQKVAA